MGGNRMVIRGKVVIITGASAGIGMATARLFASKGAKLVLVARSEDKLRSLADELRAKGCEALAFQADMRVEATVREMVEEAVRHFGRIDILINNAGQAATGTIAEVNPDDYRQIVELNVFGPLYAIQAAVPKMRQVGGGLIINISSMVSKMKIPALGAYASTKSALNMLSDTARVELAEDNIRVTTVFPRLTATDFGKNSMGDRGARRNQRDHSTGTIPIDTAEYVAERILEAAENEPNEQYMV